MLKNIQSDEDVKNALVYRYNWDVIDRSHEDYDEDDEKLDNKMTVFRIGEYYHTLGGKRDSNLYCCKDSEITCDNCVYSIGAKEKGLKCLHENGICCNDNKSLFKPKNEILSHFNGHACCWGMSVKEINVYKCKWNDGEYRQKYQLIITRNGEDFYTTPTGDFDYALCHGRNLLFKLYEFPVQLDIKDFKDQFIGRKIFYRGCPAIVKNFVDGHACVIIKPDLDCQIQNDPRFVDFEGKPYEDDFVKAEIFSDNIYWFRE